MSATEITRDTFCASRVPHTVTQGDVTGKPTRTVLLSYLQLSNTGCEIIARGTIEFLRRTVRNYELQFVVSSYDADRDRRLLSDVAGVTVVPMLGWKRYLRGALRQTGRFDKFWSPRFATHHFSSADLFVSVGGDIYTIFDGRLPDDWLGYEGFASRHGIPSIMFGANMERFERLPDEKRRRLVAHLNRFQLLMVRDRATLDYLHAHNVAANVKVFPDPVFSLRRKVNFSATSVSTIGLNLSPIATREFGDEIIGRFAEIASRAVENGLKVHLIPHVHSSTGDANLDDRATLAKVLTMIAPDLRSDVVMRDEVFGFEQVSAAIGEVDLFLGARMHACLNALTQGKAVLFLGYSKKAEAMVDWLKSETPFGAVRSALEAARADHVTFEDVKRLVHARGAVTRSGSKEIDMDHYLKESPAFGAMRELAF